ncbi:Uncharacterised protein [Chlamydia trachomatis]|nr:Uncharacterised protein [Chlamydia trachomatis]
MDFKQLGSDLLGGAAGAIGSLGVGALVNGIGSIFSHEKATPASDLLSNQYVYLGKVGNKKQSRAMESQARLAALQQYYAEKNNQQDLQNQIFMTRSAAELEAAGKRSAGLSTAGDFNGESVSSPSISSPSLPSAPMADDSPSLIDSLGFIRDVSSLMSTIKLNDSSARKNDSESDLNEIDQLTRYDENLARLDGLLQSNKISRVEYKRRKNDLLFERKSLQDRLTKEHEEAEQSKIETSIKDKQNEFAAHQNEAIQIANNLSREQLKQAKFITEHQLERYNLEIKEAMSRIDLNKASASAAYSSAALNASQKLYTDTLQQLEAAKVPHAQKLAKALYDAASADADIKRNQARITQSQVPEAKNSSFYHNSLPGKVVDYLTQPLRFVLSGISLVK